jgi:hypothetical protein
MPAQSARRMNGERPMDFMILIHTDPANEPAPGTPDFAAMMDGYMSLGARMAGIATIKAAEQLQGADSASRVQVRDGKTLVMDGAFAETREHLGGFYLIQAASRADAIAFAAAIPGATHGTIEVRPIMDYGP